FLFFENAPSEEEQLSVYSVAAKAMSGRETVIRTADFGGDKTLCCRKTDSRGIRFSLENIPLFKSQLRAILRSAVFGSVKILLPFVSTADEVKQTKALINSCVSELEGEGLEYKNAPLGVMIETPSAALISDLLAKEADFFSIGTNDLAASVMAADRFGDKASELCSVFQPAVLKAVEMTLKNANGIPVTVCGEAATDERFIDFLKERGVDRLSVSSPMIPKIKERF
ncbi:MAG: phosphoenolpyruvate--protein phosphotransferase, partial [Eubacterium sp.]|nr:phosphoenolpyruvate--protein phosphotransferase [Eubacterium sp.]